MIHSVYYDTLHWKVWKSYSNNDIQLFICASEYLDYHGIEWITTGSHNVAYITLSVWSDLLLCKHNYGVLLWYCSIASSTTLCWNLVYVSTLSHHGLLYDTQTPVSCPRSDDNVGFLSTFQDWRTNVTAIFGRTQHINNTVEIRLFSTSQVEWLPYTGQVGKFITLWCQVSCGVPKIIEIRWFWCSYSKNKKIPLFETHSSTVTGTDC